MLEKEQDTVELATCWKRCLQNSLMTAASGWNGEIVQYLSRKVERHILREIFLFTIQIGNLDTVLDLMDQVNEADDQDSRNRARHWQVAYLGTVLRAGHVHLLRWLLGQYKTVMARVLPDLPGSLQQGALASSKHCHKTRSRSVPARDPSNVTAWISTDAQNIGDSGL